MPTPKEIVLKSGPFLTLLGAGVMLDVITTIVDTVVIHSQELNSPASALMSQGALGVLWYIPVEFAILTVPILYGSTIIGHDRFRRFLMAFPVFIPFLAALNNFLLLVGMLVH